MTFWMRLKEERKKLGLNQTDFAALMGTTKKTLIDWEAGRTSPTAAQLSAISTHVDIMYIITGTTADEYVKQAKPLFDDEARLLMYYKWADEKGRQALLAAGFELSKERMPGLADQTGKQKSG